MSFQPIPRVIGASVIIGNLARRKELYEALHPETKAGKAQAAAMNKAQGRGDVSDKLSPTFAEDTSAKTGLSKRTVERDVAIGRDLAPELRDAAPDETSRR